MKLKLAWIGKTKDRSIQTLTAEYTKRISRYIQIETQEFASEAALLKSLENAMPRPYFVALDSRGKEMTSGEMSAYIGNHQDRGTQMMVFGIGGPDGWSQQALDLAQMKLSMSKLTFPHEIALVMLTEQIYRSFTILKNHPYHAGH